jgi:hypothetical protein
MRSLYLVVAGVSMCVALAGCSRQASENPQNVLGEIMKVKAQVLSQTATAQAYQAADLLTDEDIREITGYEVVRKTPGPAMGIYQNGCEWELNSGRGDVNWTITLGAMSPGGRQYFDKYLNLDGNPPIPGLGDIAVSNMGDCVTAVKGDTLVDIHYIDFSKAKEKIPERLMERIFSRLK